MKKILVILLASMMIVGLAAGAFAATITVDGALEGETYDAYKLLEYTSNGDAYSYYLLDADYNGALGTALVGAGLAFTQSADKTQWFVNNSEALEGKGANIAKYLYEHINEWKGAALASSTGNEGTSAGKVEIGDLPTGYWFVTSSLGSLCTLQSYDDEEFVVEKNTVPSIDKTEKTSGDEYVNGPVDANIGDTVHYQIVITDGTGTNAAITMTDTMTDGLDYTAGSLKINGTAVADDADTANWKVTVSGRTITIVFSAAYVASVGTGETITVTYDATINKDAVVDSATGNENKAELDYSEQHSEDKVYVETYDFLVKKTDGTNYLPGAGFKLYDAATGGNQITVGKDNTGYYVDAASDEEILVDSADGVNVRGLAPGTYYLEETTVPDGYNKLPAREPVTITTGATAAVEITVKNEAGAVLPSTGGIGTTIFYIVGGLLAVGAGVVLVTKKRMGKED